MKIGLVLIIAVVLSFFDAQVLCGDGTDGVNTSFDMLGPIANVLSPSSILIGEEKVDLAGVDSSGLNAATYEYLMQDIRDWLIGKDVLVKKSYVYFDLNGEYNTVSINEKIQKEIDDLLEGQYYDECHYYGYC